MSLNQIGFGKNAPDSFNVVIEIPSQGDPVKYEVDKETGALFVDRFIATSMTYPGNYGYIPKTLSEDGDPVDVVVLTAVPLLPNSVICARPIGVLNMTDEAGNDNKLLAVPIEKISLLYDNVRSYEDLPPALLQSIEHFFEHYKDLEPNKWVKIDSWGGVDVAKKEIMESIERYKNN